MTTTVTNESMDLSDLFPQQGEQKENSLFTKESTTINIDQQDEFAEPILPAAVVTSNPVVIPPVTVKAPVVGGGTPTVEDLENEEFEDIKQGSKRGLMEFFKAKITAGELTAFDDFDETKTTLDDYLKTFKDKDFDELWKANAANKENALAESLPQQYLDSLPDQLKYAAEYIQNGGTDVQGIFRALAQVEEVKALDPVTDARKVVEQYLKAKGVGTPEEQKEQVEEWDDLGKLEAKAKSFKPHLDQMEEVIVKQKIQEQADFKQSQADQYQFYHDNVVAAIKGEDIGGIRIDKKTQTNIYNGLTQGNQVDSKGKRCTEFEYMLDEIMWGKPDYTKLAKVFMLLKDESDFEKRLSNRAVNLNVEDIVRTLKTDQIKRTGASTPDIVELVKKRTPIARSSGLFRRN